MQDLDVVDYVPQTMSHSRMLQQWRQGVVHLVSPRIPEYVRYDDLWWRRSKGQWESIPNGPFALILTAGRARLQSLTGGLDNDERRDPWSVARDRMRLGGTCSRRHATQV